MTDSHDPMYIVMISPEIAPAAKVGGLADVIVGLARALVERGHVVDVIVPMYACMRYDVIENLHEVYEELAVPHFDKWQAEKVFAGKVAGVNTFFITGNHYTERESIYGYDDDLFRFAYFNRAALEFMHKTDKRPQIIHCHDWQTALVPVLYYEMYNRLGWHESRIVFTIHNHENQGLCGFGEELLGMIGLDANTLTQPDKLRDDNRPECINLLRGAVVYANFITAVSRRYANELRTAMGGGSVHHVINAYAAKVGGVMNGIDYAGWNPATDPKIAHNYTPETFGEKYKNKYALREWLHLADAWQPIVAVVTRLVQQKGLELIKHAIFSTLRQGGQFILLGESPDPAINVAFRQIKKELAASDAVHLWLGYHEDLAHLIYAGSDIFLVPSLYEPCGLTQLIALRYGAVPVVRETGGLADSVFDVDHSGLGLANANGYSFVDPTPAGLDSALHRAISCWYEHPDTFNKIAENGMRFDYSWDHPAKDYENIYNFIKG